MFAKCCGTNVKCLLNRTLYAKCPWCQMKSISNSVFTTHSIYFTRCKFKFCYKCDICVSCLFFQYYTYLLITKCITECNKPKTEIFLRSFSVWFAHLNERMMWINSSLNNTSKITVWFPHTFNTHSSVRTFNHVHFAINN